MRKIVKEEGFHHHCGKYLIAQMINAGPAQKREVQESLDRWFPRALAMFGPPDAQSTHGATLMKFGLKLAGNEDLRQSWLTKFVPQIHTMGLEIHDESLFFDEDTRTWSYTMPDWEEFRSLLRGGSPMGEELQREMREARYANRWVLESAAEAA
jgi:ring-1,2-phenylacetyl-CoA epoxidase subunit PaaA